MDEMEVFFYKSRIKFIYKLKESKAYYVLILAIYLSLYIYMWSTMQSSKRRMEAKRKFIIEAPKSRYTYKEEMISF